MSEFLTHITEFISENSNMKNCAVMMIDLNGLKHTNDTYGHAAGDRLLSALHSEVP